MIALYKGTSLVSKAIKFINWSEYSHASWMTSDGGEYESWDTVGVRYSSIFGSQHTKGTEVDLFEIKLTKAEIDALEMFFREQMGKKYDYMGILGFLMRKDEHVHNRWFCSELIAAGFESIKKPLLRNIPSYKVYPGMIAYSTLLTKVKTIII